MLRLLLLKNDFNIKSSYQFHYVKILNFTHSDDSINSFNCIEPSFPPSSSKKFPQLRCV